MSEYIGENGNGDNKRKVFDVRDPNHWNFLINGSTFILLVGAIFWFADMRNEWKNHKETDLKHWAITWTLPEMIQWCNMDTKKTKIAEEHTDPYEVAQRFENMKKN